MKKHTDFIFFFTVVFFLGIFAVFLEKAEAHKNNSAMWADGIYEFAAYGKPQ